MDDIIAQLWLNKLSSLKTGNADHRGIPPHKLLLLFAVMDAIESGEIRDEWVAYDPELVFRFHSYWPVVSARRRNRPDVAMPFHALAGDGVWERFTAEGDASKAQATTRLCRMDPQLFQLLQESSFRNKARTRLIETYFPTAEKIILYTRFGLPVPDSADLRAMTADTDSYQKSLRKGRDQRFKAEVVFGYNHTCALTGYRLVTETSSLVEAAHIEQHAQTGNDNPANGLALTPDAHWMFDKFLWTVRFAGDAWLVEVASGRYSESPSHVRSLTALDGRPLCFAPHTKLRPDPKYLNWHRERFCRPK